MTHYKKSSVKGKRNTFNSILLRLFPEKISLTDYKDPKYRSKGDPYKRNLCFNISYQPLNESLPFL